MIPVNFSKPAKWLKQALTRLAAIGIASVVVLVAGLQIIVGAFAWRHDQDLDMAVMIALMVGLTVSLAVVAVMFTRLKKSHIRAWETESAFKTAIESLSDGFAIIDGTGRAVVANDHLHEMLADGDLVCPLSKVQDSGANGMASGMERKLPDGRWILHRQHPLDNNGHAVVCTDITDLKRRERAIIDHAARYRDMVERSPVPIYVHRDLVVIYANSATAEILGYASPDEVVGKNIFDLIHPDHHGLGQRRLDEVRQSPKPLKQVDMKFRRKDGLAVYTEAQVSPIEFDGAPALESILYDVSARLRAERALRESELRYRNLFELSPDAIIVHDGEQVLFANDAAAKMFGAQRDIDLFGMDIITFNVNTRDGCTLTYETRAADSSPSQLQRCELRRLDGEIFHAEVVSAPTPHHGQIVQQAVIRDVTHRRRMDAAMAQNAKLASLGGMAAGLAHELSQPLNILRFAAEGGALKIERGTIRDADHKKNYRLIQDQAERMAMVMNSMRIFSRKETKPTGTFDMALSVRNISNLVCNPFRVNDVHIFINGVVSGAFAEGSAIQFEQVVLNLLNNARDSILDHRMACDLDQPGRITIDIKAEDGTNVVTIVDNGGGIDSQDIDHLFDPFFTTKDAGKGTGLGLAISHEIISAMSGTMDACDTGSGARFSVHLPKSDAPAEDAPTLQNSAINDDSPLPAHACAAEPPSREPTPPFPNITHAMHGDAPVPVRTAHVLVVEDEVAAADAMADFLRDDGFNVTVAHDGRQGLEAYRKVNPDVVITDIRMPGMSGADLIEALRKERADLPIIAVTGHVGETEHIGNRDDGHTVKVLKKPLSLMTLSKEIEDLSAA